MPRPSLSPEIIEAIKKLWTSTNHSQATIAKALGISQGAVSNIVRDVSRQGQAKIDEIVAALMEKPAGSASPRPIAELSPPILKKREWTPLEIESAWDTALRINEAVDRNINWRRMCYEEPYLSPNQSLEDYLKWVDEMADRGVELAILDLPKDTSLLDANARLYEEEAKTGIKVRHWDITPEQRKILAAEQRSAERQMAGQPKRRRAEGR